MATIHHPALGALEFDSDDNCADVTTNLGGRSISVNIWASPQSATPEKLDRAASLLKNLPLIDAAVMREIQALHASHGNDGVETYMEHHADNDVIPHAELAPELGVEAVDEAAILAKLHLIHVGIRTEIKPDWGMDENEVATLDYSIGSDITQYVLAVTLDAAYRVLSINMES